MPSDLPPVLFRNATLIDGTGAGPRAGATVLVAGGRIARIGEGVAGAGAREIDLGGRTLMPGLIDCHVHLTFAGNPDDAPLAPTTPIPVLAWTAAGNARQTLAAGITTVRDLGAREDLVILLRDQIAAGTLPGPRIRAAGMIICMTGGHGWPIGRQADGPDEVRKAVREQLRAGADVIKFTATGGVMTPRVDPRSPSFTEEELSAGIEEAHKAFVRAAAHAQGNAGIRNAVRAGIDSVEHGIFLDDEVIEEMRTRNTFFVPTLAAPANISRHGLAAGIPSYMVEKSDQIRETHGESFRRALRAGVRIAMGTDAGTPFNRHGANAEELALMVEHGMRPMDAIVAATRTAADLLNLLDVTGTIEPGRVSDLLIVNGDPIADIRVLCDASRIDGVMKEGVWVRTPRPTTG